MKFLAMVCSIEAVTSDHACIWCTCPKEKRHDMSLQWSITDSDKGARTVEEIAAKSTLPKTSKLQFNCSRSPMFDFIPMPHVVIGLLHLFLRVSDVLTNLLIRDFLILDGLEKCSDRSKAVNVNNYESNLNEKCNIRFQFHVEKVSKKLVWHDLTGPEKN